MAISRLPGVYFWPDQRDGGEGSKKEYETERDGGMGCIGYRERCRAGPPLPVGHVCDKSAAIRLLCHMPASEKTFVTVGRCGPFAPYTCASCPISPVRVGIGRFR